MIKKHWLSALYRILTPALNLHSASELRRQMPVDGIGNVEHYQATTYLEFLGRFLCGVAPFYEQKGGAKKSDIDVINNWISEFTNSDSCECLNFNQGTQPLVDSAFLALAFIRSPKVLWHGLTAQIKRQVIDALKSSRIIKPHFNNWLLFSAMIETFFFMVGEDYDKMRIDYALRQHEQWYLGDGHYGDGAFFRADYYNSFVILPFMLQITETMKGQVKDWDDIGVKVLLRAQRYAEIQERMISPDGTFPPIGRSLAYRGAAFHLLAQLALMKKLPESLKPAQVRCALWAVIENTLLVPANYDENGWLRIGLNGYQPALGEKYISTGSLYLTSVIFLPLGLSDDDEFWRAPDEPWTQRKVWWFGYDVPADKAVN